MLDDNFSSDRYSAVLGNLRDKNYLTQDDVDILLRDSLDNGSVTLINISQEKAEIVRKALMENSQRRKFD